MRHQPHQTRFLTSTNERYCRIWSFLHFPSTMGRHNRKTSPQRFASRIQERLIVRSSESLGLKCLLS